MKTYGGKPLPKGVTLTHDPGRHGNARYPVVFAHIGAGGKQRAKRFSLAAYGSIEECIKHATAWRKEQET